MWSTFKKRIIADLTKELLKTGSNEAGIKVHTNPGLGQSCFEQLSLSWVNLFHILKIFQEVFALKLLSELSLPRVYDLLFEMFPMRDTKTWLTLNQGLLVGFRTTKTKVIQQHRKWLALYHLKFQWYDQPKDQC